MSISHEEIKRIIEGSRLRADHVFEHPPVCLAIEGNHGNETYATLGNFSTILALPKVGKTTATQIIVSALLTGNQISNFVPSLPDDKKNILWIDTEQGKPECVKTIRNIAKLVSGSPDNDPENLIYYPLRQHNKGARILITEELIKSTPNLGFVVIDGIRDFVSSINDEREATLIADYLLKWTQESNIHIFTILHQNKGDENARGHLGTELMNKAETVATLSRDDSNGRRSTIFKPKFTRHKDFEEFSFSLDDNGKVFNTEIKSTYEPKNPKVDQLTYYQIEELFKAVFGENKKYTYTPLSEAIRMNLKKVLGIDFGITKLKKLITYLQDKNYLLHENKIYSSNVPF